MQCFWLFFPNHLPVFKEFLTEKKQLLQKSRIQMIPFNIDSNLQTRKDLICITADLYLKTVTKMSLRFPSYGQQ